MTIIVSVKINDGIVMASGGVTTLGSGQTYLTADKIVNLVSGLPIGIMVTGGGAIGAESITTLLKDLRARLEGKGQHKWALDRNAYTLQQVASRAREFLFEEKSVASKLDNWMQFFICGYSAGKSQPEIWELKLRGKECAPPVLLRGEDQTGVNWDGEYEPLHRLILGVGTEFESSVVSLGLSKGQAPEMTRKVIAQLYETFSVPAMPMQDAIDLARYLVQTTLGFVRFSIRKEPLAAGSPIEIAVITKHEGFQWVQRRPLYSERMNASV